MSISKELFSGSRHWLLEQPGVSAIIRKAPPSLVREITTIVFVKTLIQDEESPAVPNEVPAIAIFPSDGIDFACRKLQKTIRQPDLSPFAPNYFTIDPMVNGLLLQIRLLDPQKEIAAELGLSLVIAAAGKGEDEVFELYTDTARRDPDFATDWGEMLFRQFGGNALYRAMSRYRSLFRLIEKTRRLAQDFSKGFSIKESGLGTDLTYDLASYQEQAYRLRGLDPPVKAIDTTVHLLHHLDVVPPLT